MEYLVWRYGGNKDFAEEISAAPRDACEAAEIWAARADARSTEYEIAKGEDAHVLVVPVDDPEARPKLCVVRGEAVPSYYAIEVEP